MRQGTTFKLGTFSYEARVLDSNSNVVAVNQVLASGSGLASTASIIGAWMFADADLPYALQVNVDGTLTTGATISGNGTFQYNTLAFTPGASAATVRAQVVVSTIGTIFIDQLSVIPSVSSLTDDLSDRVQRSAAGLADDWNGVDSGTNDVVTTGDIGLTGSGILTDKLYIFKKHSIHRFTYTASEPLVAIKEISSRIGTSSPKSIRNVDIPGAGPSLIFLGTDRVLYRFDGFESTSVSDKIQENNGITTTYMKNINTAALDRVFAVVHDKLPWYELFVSIGTATTPTHSFTYDYLTGAFWPNDNRNFSAGEIADRGDGLREVYVQETTTGIAMRTTSTNSDSGTTINGLWTSAKLGGPTILDKIDEINVITESIASSTPTFSWRADFETTYIDKTMTESVNLHNWNPGRIDNLIQYKITDDSSNPTFKVWDITSLSRSLGHAR